MTTRCKHYHPVKTVLAMVSMLLFIACLVVYVWMSNLAARTHGPVHIAAAAGQVLVSFNGEILVLDNRGTLQQRQSLEALGIDPYPIDLRFLDGTTVLIAGQHPASLHRCSVPGWWCRAVHSPLLEQLRGPIKVVRDPAGEGLLLSDTAAGDLHRLALDGTQSQTLTTPGQLERVNDLAVDGAGRLWVADSGHRRIAVFAPDHQGGWNPAGELSARSGLTRPGLDWPMMIAFAPRGEVWVIQPDPRLERSDLVIYSEQQGIQARIDLGDTAYPTDLVRAASTMLITDRVNFDLLQVDLETRTVAPFGDRALRTALETAAAQRATADRRSGLAVGGMLVFGVLMILLAVWASPKGRRFTPQAGIPVLEPAPLKKPTHANLHWLVRNPKTERFLQTGQRVLLLSTAGMLVLLVYAGFLLNDLHDHERVQRVASCVTGLNELLALFAAFVISVPVLAWFAIRPMRNRLGSDGRQLYLQRHDGLRMTLNPAKLVYTRRILAFEDQLFPIRTGNGKPLYAEGELETHVAPLLGQATRLNEFELLGYQLRHQEPVSMISLFYIVGFTAALWYTGAWRLLLAGS